MYMYILPVCMYVHCIPSSFHYNLCIYQSLQYVCSVMHILYVLPLHHNLYSISAVLIVCFVCVCITLASFPDLRGKQRPRTRLGNEASITSPSQSVQYISTVLCISSVHLITSLSLYCSYLCHKECRLTVLSVHRLTRIIPRIK